MWQKRREMCDFNAWISIHMTENNESFSEKISKNPEGYRFRIQIFPLSQQEQNRISLHD